VVVEWVTVVVGVATVGAVMMAAVGADSTGATTTDVELVTATTLVIDTDEGHFRLMVLVIRVVGVVCRVVEGWSGWRKAVLVEMGSCEGRHPNTFQID
jgi:hypothetical protein